MQTLSTTPRSTTPTTRPTSGHRRPGLRRRTLSTIGIALFLAGLLFGEAIEAVAALDEPQPAPTAVATFTDPALTRAVADAQAARAEEAIATVSTAAVTLVHDQLLRLAAEGISLERREIWRALADCESGDWYRGVPIADSRRWDTTAGFFEGGLQFHPRTWDGFRDPDMPSSANLATPVTQMVVAERVLEAQGWKAWPVCSRKLGYR